MEKVLQCNQLCWKYIEIIFSPNPQKTFYYFSLRNYCCFRGNGAGEELNLMRVRVGAWRWRSSKTSKACSIPNGGGRQAAIWLRTRNNSKMLKTENIVYLFYSLSTLLLCWFSQKWEGLHMHSLNFVYASSYLHNIFVERMNKWKKYENIWRTTMRKEDGAKCKQWVIMKDSACYVRLSWVLSQQQMMQALSG